MAKRYKRPNNKQDLDRVIEPDSSEYGKFQDKFEHFPSTKRYHAVKPPPPSKRKPPREYEHKQERGRRYRRGPDRGRGRGLPPKYRYKYKTAGKEPERRQKEIEERFDIAFVASLALIALFSLFTFIPIIGPVLALTLVPYLACYRGCRYVNSRNGVQVGLLVGVVWSIVEFYLLFQILNFVKISVAEPGIYTNIDMLLVVLICLGTISFSMFGGYMGGKKFQAQKHSTEENKKIEKHQMQPGPIKEKSLIIE